MKGRWQGLLAEARALSLPLGTYWAANLVPMAIFCVLIVLLEGFDVEVAAILGGLCTGAILGIACGQLLALLRVRTPLVVLFAVTLVTAWTLLFVTWALALPGAELAGIFLVGAFFLLPFFLVAGLWSLRVDMALLATWGPMVWIAANILIIAERHDGVARWHEGQKWALWNIWSASALGIGVVLLLVYLVARELHRLHRWRHAHNAPGTVARSSPGVRRGRALPGCGGLLALLALGLALSFGTALLAPYLWRTGPADRGPESDQSTEAQLDQQQDERRRRDPSAHGEGDGGAGDGLPEWTEQARRAAQHALWSLLLALLLVALALGVLLVFGPPVRRALLLQHLRRPYWPVGPSHRIRLHWRMVEIALADLGVRRRPGESATMLVRRALNERTLLDPEDLVRCAAVVDRVVYGLGLAPDDTMRARRTAEMTYRAVWEELTERQKLLAIYRFL